MYILKYLYIKGSTQYSVYLNYSEFSYDGTISKLRMKKIKSVLKNFMFYFTFYYIFIHAPKIYFSKIIKSQLFVISASTYWMGN